MFYEIYRDRNVLNGGMWFDPEENELLEVIDMDSATGATGVTLIDHGSVYITEKKLETAVKSSGLFAEEPPPEPPKGRKHWFSRPWSPPPRPGYLFWMPEQAPVGYRIMKAWEDWTAFGNEGGSFSELPKEVQGYVFQGVEAIMRYYGMTRIGSDVVISESKGAAELEKRDWPGAIISSNPEEEVWKILENMGVRRNA